MSKMPTPVELCVLVAWVVTNTRASAQGIGPYFGIGGGAGVPTGDYHSDTGGSGFKTGWQGMVLVDLKTPRSPIGLRVDAIYSDNKSHDVLPYSQTLRMFGGSLDVACEFPVHTYLKPYLLAGAGLHNLKLSNTGATGNFADCALSAGRPLFNGSQIRSARGGVRGASAVRTAIPEGLGLATVFASSPVLARC